MKKATLVTQELVENVFVESFVVTAIRQKDIHHEMLLRGLSKLMLGEMEVLNRSQGI
tara:strand:+ start:508 stop:678 length:171 start_codon:yes stop_codon:yes gene_type:complete